MMLHWFSLMLMLALVKQNRGLEQLQKKFLMLVVQH